MSNKKEITKFIKSKALEIGFDACGITKAEHLFSEKEHLQSYLKKGFHGEMQYMENNFEKRLDTSLLVEGSRSVILVLLNYYPKEQPLDANSYKVAKYAYGKRYQDVMKNMLHSFLESIQKEYNEVQGRAFVDTAPLLEKALAARAGLGWIGKNSLLINKELGSFLFIGELVVNTELEYDKPVKDHCGDCTLCIDACPVNAIDSDKVINASKCISYHTIEKRSAGFPKELKNNMNNWIFGCDSCQDVCPWNQKLNPNKVQEFIPKHELLKMKNNDWQTLSQEKFDQLFKGTPVERTKYSGLKRNIDFVNRVC